MEDSTFNNCNWLSQQKNIPTICDNSSADIICPSTCTGLCPIGSYLKQTGKGKQNNFDNVECDDKLDQTFRMRNNNLIEHTCLWLSRKRVKVVKFFCKNNPSALENCVSTCAGRCEEKSVTTQSHNDQTKNHELHPTISPGIILCEDKKFARFNLKKDTSHTCNWLSKRKVSQINKTCADHSSNASIKCVSTCAGRCKEESQLSTFSPTKKTTLLPTLSPISRPTIKPTWQPTSNPTKIPTYNLTNKPSSTPSTTTPTIKPTWRPTSNPTKIPTYNLTKKPSSTPSQTHSINPTKGTKWSPTKNPILRYNFLEKYHETKPFTNCGIIMYTKSTKLEDITTLQKCLIQCDTMIRCKSFFYDDEKNDCILLK